MSYPTRSLAVGVGGTSSASSSSGPQSVHLLARIREKKAELDNLVQLRELSAAVAAEMEKLEQKLGTLSEGTEAIATVVANWNSVLQAINMASVALTKPRNNREDDEDEDGGNVPLPEMLVRIPTEDAPTLQAHADVAAEGQGEEQEGKESWT